MSRADEILEAWLDATASAALPSVAPRRAATRSVVPAGTLVGAALLVVVAVGIASGRLDGSPAGTFAPSPVAMSVTIPLDASHSLAVTIRDASGSLVSARPATETELAATPGGPPSAAAAFNPGGAASPELTLVWAGGICDTTAAVDIASDVRSITVAPGPVGSCDSTYVGRGLVLTFRSAIDARTVTVSVAPSSSPSAAVEHRALSFRVVPADGHVPTAAELQAVSNVLLERIAVYAGSSGAAVGGEGTDRLTVAVDVPTNDPGFLERVATTLTAPGQVAFVPLGSGGQEPGQTIDPADTSLFGGDAVTSASVLTDPSGGPVLALVLSPNATEVSAAWSTAHIGSQFAITLDGRIELAPIMQSPVTDGHLDVTADSSGPEAIDRLAAVLRSGPLPVPVVLVPSGP
jgi:hypothetical protein